jgi:eukaryotic-like serine/threonine-protein kinase
MIGTQIGPYHVLEKIGEGGMGAVYRARDPRLSRDVALKVLTDAAAADPDRLARFQREAQVLAGLHHPNIAAIYGLEEKPFSTADTVPVLVLELVEGETLADRIGRGAMPLDETIPVARQIADALEAAHEHGIVHRDLKPSNIKIAPDGVVKVLDFGLAKLAGPPDTGPYGRPDVSSSPTLTSPATQAGVILGTAAYMAPEQATGRAVDKRADIWAFGSVVFEMLAGRRPFAGDSTTELFAAVTRDEPDWNGLPIGTPERLRYLIARCLEKDPKRRLRDIGEARVILDGPLDRGFASEPVMTARPRYAAVQIAAVALVAFIAGIAGMRYLGRTPPAERLIRAVIPAPGDGRFHLDAGSPGAPVVSPDGLKIAFVAYEEGRARLWVRDLASTQARALAGTDDVQYPFWSADSRSLGFFASNKLRRVELTGGLPVPLADALNGKGGTWNSDGVIVFAPDSDQALYRVAASGGAASPATALARDKGENSHRLPYFLPDGRHFLFIARGDTTGTSSTRRGGSLRVGSLDDTSSRELASTDSQGIYSAGSILYVQPQTMGIVSRPFDLRALQWSGDPTPVVDNVLLLQGSMVAVFSVAPNGVLAYMTGDQIHKQRLAWTDRSGRTLQTIDPDFGDYNFDLSPDGRRIAVEGLGVGGAEDIWSLDVARGTRVRMTAALGSDANPVWAPDGESILFQTDRSGRKSWYWKAVAGGSEQEIATMPNAIVSSWSADGRQLAFYSDEEGEKSGIWVVDVERSRPPKIATPQRVVHSGTVDRFPRFSPDGQWLAFSSRAGGTSEVYVMNLRGERRQWQVSDAGGSIPSWRPDGKELFYLTQKGEVAAVTVNIRGTEVDLSAPSLLFATGRPSPFGNTKTSLQVTADGMRFLVLRADDSAGPDLLTLVSDWTIAR